MFLLPTVVVIKMLYAQYSLSHNINYTVPHNLLRYDALESHTNHS